MWGYGLDGAGSKQGQVVSTYECGNERRPMYIDENISLSSLSDKCFRPEL